MNPYLKGGLQIAALAGMAMVGMAGSISAQEVPKNAIEAECWSDYAQYCGEMRRGGGKIYDCLEKNKATLTDPCRAALPSLKKMTDEAVSIKVAQAEKTKAATASTSTKPNFLIIWGDDVGYWNISSNNKGMMGYRTPNIDRIAAEGASFTDWYGQQSCTAGRAAFITGQSPFRTGLLKVGLPGAKEGMSIKDPTIAGLLKNHGYMTAQLGKNHLGDLDEMLPTNHGFDEFFGNLYHLNAEEEPEHEDYPKSPEFKKKFGPRGVIKSTAGGKIEDTGPLTRKRMETVDEEVTSAALDFMDRA